MEFMFATEAAAASKVYHEIITKDWVMKSRVTILLQ